MNLNIGSFTDDQLLNLINSTITEETDFKEADMTGGYVQSTATHKSKIVAYKINLLFGYDKNKNSRQHQKEISMDSYFIWAKAILLKTQSLIISTTGQELDEMNRRMNKTSKKEKNSNGNGNGNGYVVVGSERTTNSTSVVLPTKAEASAIKVAEYLLSKIRASNPKFKQPNISIWAKDIDKAIRLDHRTEDELTGCIDWIYSEQGDFWQSNILSGKKLREKFDTMQAQSRSKSKKNTTMVDKIYDAGMTAKDMVKEMEKRA